MFLFDFLYFLIILITLPYWIKFLLKKEYRQILKKRIFPDFSYSKKKKRIWIHAVSVGEVSSLKNLIDKLIKDYNQKIVLSVTTPSGFNYAFKEYKQIEVVNAPLDLSFIIKNFYQRINPTILILNELEIWPNWIFMLKKKKIPIILINGRVSQRAFKRYHRFRFFLRPIFNRIDLFLLQSEFFKNSFKKLKIMEDKLLISGNIKADEAIESKKHS
jgi:3-deoxy-D-manno-octulosonic-acid transferase